MLKLYPFLFRKENFLRRLSIAAFVVSLLSMLLFTRSYTPDQDVSNTQMTRKSQTAQRKEITVQENLKKRSLLQAKELSVTKKSLRSDTKAQASLEKNPKTQVQVNNNAIQRSNRKLSIAINRSDIIRPFGWYKHPIYKDWRLHSGIDLMVMQDENIKAMTDGRVVRVVSNRYLGSEVQVESDNGLSVVYGYFKNTKVHDNQVIRKGQVIGQLGTSEGEKGLHLEVRKDNQSLNPENFIE